MGVTSIRIQADIEEPLTNLSKKLDRSKNYLINQALKEFIARHGNEEEKWKDTLSALDSVKTGKVVSESKVTNWLNSWGSKEEINPPEA